MRSKPRSVERHAGRLLPAVALLTIAACAPQDDATSRRLAAFGTLVTVTVFTPDDLDVDNVVARLERHFRRRETDWYPWADGELAAINAAFANGEAVRVGGDLKRLLERARSLEAASGGWFNPALGALTELWGFHEPLTEDWRPPADVAIDELLTERHGSARLSFDGDRLSSSRRRLVLDPGGVAKGALLEESVAILARAGVEDAIVDLGGDLVVLGSPPGRAARIGIRRPGGDDALAWLAANSGEAVVTSGDYERYFEYAGRHYAHILDPRTGRPAPGVASVTVVARDAVKADAAATALAAAGPAHFDELVAALDLEFALLVDETGDVRLTPAMAGRVHWLSR